MCGDCGCVLRVGVSDQPDVDRRTTVEGKKAEITAECQADWQAKFDALESRMRVFERTLKVEGIWLWPIWRV